MNISGHLVQTVHGFIDISNAADLWLLLPALNRCWSTEEVCESYHRRLRGADSWRLLKRRQLVPSDLKYLFCPLIVFPKQQLSNPSPMQPRFLSSPRSLIRQAGSSRASTDVFLAPGVYPAEVNFAFQALLWHDFLFPPTSREQWE